MISSLGSPEELASSIISANTKEEPQQSGADEPPKWEGFSVPPTGAQSQSGKWTGGQIALLVVLLVLSSPIWLSILSVFLTVISAVFCAAIGIVIGLAACAVAFFADAVAAFAALDPVLGFLLLGFSLVFIGLFPLAIYPLCKLLIKLVSVCAKGIAGLISKLTGRKGVNAQ